MGKYTAYPEYKDSGVEWLGEVPAHWRTSSLKHFCNLITDGSHHSPQAVGNGHPYVTVKDLSNGSVDLGNSKRISTEDYAMLVANGCSPKKGDVLFSKDGTIGKVAIVQQEGFVVLSSLAIISPDTKKILSSFIYYLLCSNNILEQVHCFYAGAALKRITLDSIVDLQISAPKASEQTQIAAFLDQETAKIDRLIAKQEELIALLQEKRQAVISHAVTKGLDPDAPMKDSGVEWLGEVPAHWEVKPIKSFAKVGNGSTPKRDNPDYWASGTFPWLNSSVVNFEQVTEAEYHVTDLALAECHLPILEPPVVLIGITGQGKRGAWLQRLTSKQQSTNI